MDRSNKKAVFLIGYIIAVLWGYSYISISERNIEPSNFIFLILPTACILISKAFEYIANKYLRGDAIPVAASVVTRICWGLAGFFYMSFMPGSSSYKQAAICILISSFIGTLFLLLPLIKSHIVLSSSARAFLYIILGLTLSWMFKILWVEGIWDAGIKIHASSIVLFGYMIVAACSFLYMLILSRNAYIAGIGKWFGKDYGIKLIISFALVFAISDVYGSLMEKYTGEYAKFQWLFIFLVLVVLLIVFLIKANSFWTVSIHPELKMHLLDIKYIKDKEISTLSQYVTEFIEYGNKTRLITYLAFLASNMNISVEAAGSMTIKPLVEYSDIKTPLFSLKREMDVIDDLNKENRRIIVQNIINSLKNHGG